MLAIGWRFCCPSAYLSSGWLCEALEVYVILYYIGPPVDAVASISIAAVAAIIKGGCSLFPVVWGRKKVETSCC